MKRHIALLIAFVFIQGFSIAQQRILIHNGSNVMYETPVSGIDTIHFQTQSSLFNFMDGTEMSIPISAIDSITFSDGSSSSGNIVYVTYNGNSAAINNPLESAGVAVTVTDGHVSVNSTSSLNNIEYHLSGITADGSFTIASDEDILISLNNVQIINPSGSAINVTSKIRSTIRISGTESNVLSDGTGSSKNATILCGGDIVMEGYGKLTVSGLKKHTVSSASLITVNGGTVHIPASASDGFHCEQFVMNGGWLTIHADGDGIDAGGGTLEINNGIIDITSSADDVKGVKSDSDLTINGGTITMTISGAQSKGISGKADVYFNGGTTRITTSGAVVLEPVGSGYDPSYCSAVKAKGDIIVRNATINFTGLSAASGGKGLSADGDIRIYSGDITISMAGNGATYTDENGQTDSYSACCIKSDGNILIETGSITCTSTGTAGKGISADGTLTIGLASSNNEHLILNVSTSGERFYVSGYGDNADYANPKAVKSEGNLTVNSGIITIVCSQNDEGGEGLESKDTLSIHGGIIDIQTVDDCINASNHIAITGGTVKVKSTGNDAIDSNGTLSISGGLIIANGDRAPEGGIDCDQSRFAMTGGTLIGTGGSTSNPTANASTQNSMIYRSGTQGSAICIKNSNNETILLYEIPNYASSSGGGPGGPGGGGGNSVVVLFSDPALVNGSYTLQYGGSISGGNSING
ncbi:carbohydrate-binding domain-containing protein, partial [Bacteroidales bacterium OttesenSCG-928-E04]|nr:carbohydrate-binding domain-containing protein [Bacteroidales bacterium OttesenSCG-928-E04]